MTRTVPWLAVAMFAAVVGVVVLAPWLPLPDPRATGVGAPMSGASPRHWLGTDELGRDLLARAVAGGRTSLIVGWVAVAIAGLIGGPLGIVAGYLGGSTDAIVGFATDVVLAVPVVLIGAAVVALLPTRGPLVVATVIGLAFVPSYVRVARERTRQVSSEGFVQSAVAIGAGPSRIMATTIAPRVARSLSALAAVAAASAIALEGALGFLGLSAPPPTPTWGGMLAAGIAVSDRGLWPTLVPAAAIVVTIAPLTIIGDALGSRFDEPEPTP